MTTQMSTPAFRLNPILRDCADGLFILDPGHRYVEFSTACERITGLSRESVLGSRCSCQLPTDCRAEQERSLVGALCPGLRAFSDEAGSFKQKMRFRRPDGRSVSIETTFSRIAANDGDSSYLVGIMRDVTDAQPGDAGDREVTAIDFEGDRAGSGGAKSSEADGSLLADGSSGSCRADGSSAVDDSSLGALDRILSGIERDEIVRALRRAGGQRMMAARVLGISRSRLYRRMEALGIDPRRVAASLDES